MELELINLDLAAGQAVIVQVESFSKHRFVEASAARCDLVAVDGRWLEVELGPGVGTPIRIMMDRYVNSPSYETPWSRREDWDPIIRPRAVRTP